LTLQEAREFFTGLPPADLRTSNITHSRLQKKMARLKSEVAWLDMCVKSYRSSRPVDDPADMTPDAVADLFGVTSSQLARLDGDEVKEVRIYQIFGTQLKEPGPA
jgi:hypothetical protein